MGAGCKYGIFSCPVAHISAWLHNTYHPRKRFYTTMIISIVDCGWYLHMKMDGWGAYPIFMHYKTNKNPFIWMTFYSYYMHRFHILLDGIEMMNICRCAWYLHIIKTKFAQLNGWWCLAYYLWVKGSWSIWVLALHPLPPPMTSIDNIHLV